MVSYYYHGKSFDLWLSYNKKKTAGIYDDVYCMFLRKLA